MRKLSADKAAKGIDGGGDEQPSVSFPLKKTHFRTRETKWAKDSKARSVPCCDSKPQTNKTK